MNKAHQLAVKYCSQLSDETATKAIGDAFVAGFQAAQLQLIPVSERLPESNCPYGASVLATNGKFCFFATYTTGGTIEVADENEEESYLSEGWYECEEQTNHPFAEEVWFKRDVIAWCHIPESLLNFKP